MTIVIVMFSPFRFTSDHDYFSHDPRTHFGYIAISEKEFENLPSAIAESMVPLYMPYALPIMMGGNC